MGIADEQRTDEQRLVLRQHAVTYFPKEPEVYAILARLLSLPLAEADEDLIKDLAGPEFRTRLFSIIERELIGLSGGKPVVVLFEDLHWADQSSIDLLNYVLPLTAKAPLLSYRLPGAILEGCRSLLHARKPLRQNERLVISGRLCLGA